MVSMRNKNKNSAERYAAPELRLYIKSEMKASV